MTTRAQNRITGFHVLFGMVAFFAVVIGVNVIFITRAISTFPGEEVHRAYTRGAAYNETLEARARQAERGWTASIGFAPWGEDYVLVVELRDADGQPLGGLNVNTMLERPATTALDRSVTLEDAGDGRYVAALTGVDAGAWNVRVATEFSDGAAFEARRSLVLR